MPTIHDYIDILTKEGLNSRIKQFPSMPDWNKEWVPYAPVVDGILIHEIEEASLWRTALKEMRANKNVPDYLGKPEIPETSRLRPSVEKTSGKFPVPIAQQDIETAEALSNRAVLLRARHHFEEAADAAEQALETFEVLNRGRDGALNLSVALTMNNLRTIYARQGRVDEAVEFSERACRLFLECDLSPAALALSQYEMMVIYETADRWEEAEKMGRLAIEAYERLAKDTPWLFEPELATSHNGLGIVMAHLDRLEEAAEHFATAAALILPHAKENPYGDHADWFSNQVRNCLKAYDQMGRLEEAEARLGEEVVEYYEQTSMVEPAGDKTPGTEAPGAI